MLIILNRQFKSFYYKNSFEKINAKIIFAPINLLMNKIELIHLFSIAISIHHYESNIAQNLVMLYPILYNNN